MLEWCGEWCAFGGFLLLLLSPLSRGLLTQLWVWSQALDSAHALGDFTTHAQNQVGSQATRDRVLVVSVSSSYSRSTVLLGGSVLSRRRLSLVGSSTISRSWGSSRSRRALGPSAFARKGSSSYCLFFSVFRTSCLARSLFRNSFLS